jgi:acyl-CoA hydrolase
MPSSHAGIPVAHSAIEDYFHEIFPQDLNSMNTVFGGRVMELADRVAAVAARRHSGQLFVATLQVDSMRFHQPAYRGETLLFKASVNRVWNTSMEIGVAVHAHDCERDLLRHIVSAYFTFVALDQASRRPVPIRPVIPETPEQHRRYADADRRRQHRREQLG